MKWWFAVLVFVFLVVMVPKKTFLVMQGKTSDNNSPERMKKIRAIKAKKAEERNRAQMKKVA